MPARQSASILQVRLALAHPAPTAVLIRHHHGAETVNAY